MDIQNIEYLYNYLVNFHRITPITYSIRRPSLCLYFITLHAPSYYSPNTYRMAPTLTNIASQNPATIPLTSTLYHSKRLEVHVCFVFNHVGMLTTYSFHLKRAPTALLMLHDTFPSSVPYNIHIIDMIYLHSTA